MRRFAIYFFVVVVLLSLSGCYPVTRGPWKGKVVDANTKAPIEGAVVVAVWEKSTFGGPGGPVESYFDAKETLTDKDGNFEFPTYKYMHYEFIRAMTGPNFTIFKPGYGSYPNYQVSPTDLHDVFKHEVTVVELPKLTDNDKRLWSMMEARTGAPREKTPKFYELINIERKNLGLPQF